jgi:hypothetical protein
MGTARSLAAISFLFCFGIATAPAQTTAVASAPPCVSDWGCSWERPPLGFYVQAVDAGGRYVTLEDGTLWEVEYSDRATAAGWQSDDFVRVSRIWAPREGFDFQFSRAGQADQRAAVRLAGRRAPAERTDSEPPPPAQE